MPTKPRGIPKYLSSTSDSSSVGRTAAVRIPLLFISGQTMCDEEKVRLCRWSLGDRDKGRDLLVDGTVTESGKEERG